MEETNEQRIERTRKRLEGEARPKTLKLWKKARTPKESDEEYLSRKLRDSSEWFKKSLERGKYAEERVSALLRSLQFHVDDISSRIDSDNRVSPFDIYIRCPDGREFIADIKHQTPEGGAYLIRFGEDTYLRWVDYKTEAAKLLIFYSEETYKQEYTRHLPYILRGIRICDIAGKRLPYKDTNDLMDII